MKLLCVFAAILSLAWDTCGQELSRVPAVPPGTERLIVGEEWNRLSSCRTSRDNYLCPGQRTSVSVAIALNTGICTATVNYVNCLESSCPSSQALTESFTRIRDRCQGFGVKSSATSSTTVTTSTTRTAPTSGTTVRTSTTRAAPTSGTTVRTSRTRAAPTSGTTVQTSTTRAAPTLRTNDPTSTTERAPTHAYFRSLISETDLIDNEWSTLTTCRFLAADTVCNVVKKTLQSMLIIESGVCGAALDYVACLETNCHSSSDLDASIQRVRDRCNGQAPDGKPANTVVLATAASTPQVATQPTTAASTPRVVTQRTTTQQPESDVVAAEWNTLVTCHLVDDEEEETCDDLKTHLQRSLQSEVGVCVSAIDFVDCLENVCRQTYSLTNSISRIRNRCTSYTSNGQGSAGSPNTPVTDESVVSNEWHTLSTCILLDPEEEDCGEPKTDLRDALRTDSEVCEAASAYVECLEEACLVTHSLTESFSKVKARCDEEGEDPEENSHSNQPGTAGSESTVVYSELHTLTTCALLDSEEEDCGEPRTDLQEALASNSEVCEAALGYVECLEEACLVTHTLTNSFTRIRNRCEDGEEEDD